MKPETKPLSKRMSAVLVCTIVGLMGHIRSDSTMIHVWCAAAFVILVCAPSERV